ncbi:hypothetical protein V5O48_000897 [Marasmius crinis-equi]|uniref:Cytosine-specific methyltransferase n=1 Tax=Marasmius crinis-equi TaxID=585013 RepID=A0ABR3FZW1_9AGAR
MHNTGFPYVEITTPRWLQSQNVNTSHSTSLRCETRTNPTTQEDPKLPKKARIVLDCVQIDSQKRKPEAPEENCTLRPRKRRRSGNTPPATPQKSLPGAGPGSPTVSEVQFRLRQSPTISNHIARDAPSSQLSKSRTRFPSPEVSDEDTLFGGVEYDEVIEDEHLVIPGEDRHESGDGRENSEVSEDIPVRVITDFSVYDNSTSMPVDFMYLDDDMLEEGSFGASGDVTPWIEPGDDGDDFDLQYTRVKLSRLLEVDTHWLGDEGLDGKIYLRTKYAWYILDLPAEAYRPLYLPFFTRQRLCHLALSRLLEEEELTTEEFVSNLKSLQTRYQKSNLVPKGRVILRRSLTQDDMDKKTMEYLSATIPEVLSSNDLQYLRKAPLVKLLLGHGEWPRPRDKPENNRRKKRKDTDDSNIVVTPIVKAIIQDLFELTLDVAGTSTFEEENEAVQQELQISKEHHDDPKKIRWGKTMVKGLAYYESVTLDGETYRPKQIGDDVMVIANKDEGDEWNVPENGEESTVALEDESRPVSVLDPTEVIAKKGNYYANNNVWFCKISYFFDHPKDVDPKTRKPVKMFHGQWYQHGSRTMLQETAHSHSLFLLPSCDDNPVTSIFRKCEVRFLEPGQNEEVDDKSHMATNFHCTLMWDNEQFSFRDIPTLVGDDLEELCKLQPPHMKCLGCALQERQDMEAAVAEVDGGFSRYGISYHVNDFVYLTPQTDASNLLEIAQITHMESQSTSALVSVRMLLRRDDVVELEEGGAKEEKRLVYSQETRNLDFDCIDSKCFVQHLSDEAAIEEWIRATDHWYLNEKQTDNGRVVPKGSLKICNECLDSREEDLSFRRDKLRGLELFSGCGGLGMGMDYSGFVETRWAVEYWNQAARTYGANHPHTAVYCQDVNSLLRHAIETREGKNPKSLQSKYSSKSACPEMPERGDVDVIYGGPPCQAFSGANHNQKANDPRATLPFTMLSYVEEYEPDYFLLENVTGFLRHPLKSTQDGRRLVGGIKMGMTKMVVRVLMALGYQVHFKVLQAGQYGSPQGRERIIFWGAKRGLKLPEFPIPTHAFPRSAVWKLPCNKTRPLPPPTRSRDPDVTGYLYAPLRAVSVFDAIDDLPPFEWINPHEIIQATKKDKEEVKARLKDGIKQCQVPWARTIPWGDLPGFPNGAKYSSPPNNMYQRWMREQVRDDDLVQGHTTNAFSSTIVERTVTVPLKGGANHKDLPLDLVPKCARPGRRQADKNGEKYFKTALTRADPGIKGIYSLHPTQKRNFTVREVARSQGFPDHYKFLSESEEANAQIRDFYKQIGNAVPVPLSLALGRELGKALKVNWERRTRESSPEH